jgi:hypothetical protein
MKSGNLNFLEPSGPLQACNGTALPFLNLVVFLSAYPENMEISFVPLSQGFDLGYRIAVFLT